MASPLFAIPYPPDLIDHPTLGDEAAAPLTEIVDRTACLQPLQRGATIGTAGLKAQLGVTDGAALFAMARIQGRRTRGTTGRGIIHGDAPDNMSLA
jgi:hypothetical protein